MSDVDVERVPDPVADLVDADASEFDDAEAFREFVDQRLAEIEAAGAERDDRLDAQGTRADALSRKLDTVREQAKRAERRAKRAEKMAAWGGLGYHERLWQVVETLVRRAERGRMGDLAAHITTGETEHRDEQGNRYARPGVYQLFDGGVSERTCRRYIRDLAQVDGLDVEDGDRGGWGGGSTQMRLTIDLPTFRVAYGDDWDVEDVVDDMEGGR
jgi:hypothetical protein